MVSGEKQPSKDSTRPEGPPASFVKLALFLAFVAVAFGIVAYQIDQKETHLRRDQQTLGFRFGCTTDFPIPGSSDFTGEAGCYTSAACSVWGRPSCTGFTLDSKYLATWDALEEQRDNLRSKRVASTAIAILSGYLVVAWYLHSLLLAILRRFMFPKWALLVAFIVNVITMNVVGAVRAIVGLLRVPPVVATDGTAPTE